jgi:hypothetical protein
MDGRRLRPAHDIQRNRLVRITVEADAMMHQNDAASLRHGGTSEVA